MGLRALSSPPLPYRIMTRSLLIATAALLTLTASTASAQSASQDVTVVVPEVESLSVSSSALTLTFLAPEVGGSFADVTNATSTYSLTVNTAGNKITGVLDAAYATGITLAVSLAAPSGGASAGSTTLGTAAVDLVTGVSNVNASGLGITYTASADATALPNAAGETQTVTFTITGQ